FSSSSSAAKSPLLLFREWPGVNHVDRVVGIENEDDLQESTSTAATPDKPLIVFNFSRKRIRRVANNCFRFFRRNSVASDMFDVPAVPAEVHDLFMQENAAESTPIRLHIFPPPPPRRHLDQLRPHGVREVAKDLRPQLPQPVLRLAVHVDELGDDVRGLSRPL